MDRAGEGVEVAIGDGAVAGVRAEIGLEKDGGRVARPQAGLTAAARSFSDGDQPAVAEAKDSRHCGLDEVGQTQAAFGAAGQRLGAGGLRGRHAVEMQLDAGFRAGGIHLAIGPADLTRARGAADDDILAGAAVSDGVREDAVPVVFAAAVGDAHSTLGSGVMPDHQSDLGH